MSAAFEYIVIAPVFFESLKKFGSVVSLTLVILIPRIPEIKYPGGVSPLSFLPAFCFGMIFAHEQIFGKIDKKNNSPQKHFVYGLLSVITVFLCYKLSRVLPDTYFWDIKYDFFTAIYVTAIYLTLSKIPYLNTLLSFLGKHSGNIFMTHTFIFYYYMQDFIYGQHHFLLIMLVLLLMSLALSIILEAVKNGLRTAFSSTTHRI